MTAPRSLEIPVAELPDPFHCSVCGKLSDGGWPHEQCASIPIAEAEAERARETDECPECRKYAGKCPACHRKRPAPDRTETSAARYVREHEKGLWRTARKAHRCDHYWTRECLGDGSIHAGDRYFDTEELREYTKGPVPFRCCRACAQARGDAARQEEM